MELVTLSKCDEIKYTVTLHPDFNGNDKALEIAKDYRRHKNKEVCNLGLFGRDVSFTENPQLKQSCVFKVHLIEEDQYNFKIDQFHNTSNLVHMIYCQHIDDPLSLCVIDFLTPEAHQQAYKIDNINRIVSRAEDFHARPLKKIKTA